MIDPYFLKKKKRSKWKYPLASLLLHILIIGGILIAEIHFRREMIQDEIKKMLEVKTISPQELQKIITRARVVDTELANENELSDTEVKKVYAGEKSQRVKKETRAAEGGSSRGSSKDQAAKNLNQNTTKSKQGPFGRRLTKNEKTKLKKGNYDVLDPSVSVASKTLLNTEAYIHATFTNRMKESIAAIWDPKARQILQNTERRIGMGIYITTVRIFILKDGTVSKVVVEQSAGVPELDQAGVRSIYEVRSFPNPPPDLFKAPSKGDFEFSFVASVVPGKLFRFNYVHDDKLDRIR